MSATVTLQPYGRAHWLPGGTHVLMTISTPGAIVAHGVVTLWHAAHTVRGFAPLLPVSTVVDMLRDVCGGNTVSVQSQDVDPAGVL